MTERTKTVGTSTSMTPSSTTTSSPTRTPSSSSRIDRFNSVSLRSIGFLPPHTPDSASVKNSSLNDMDPPPYPEDSSFPNQDPPPYPIDELPFRKDLPPYPLGPIDPDTPFNPLHIPFPIPANDINFTTPSAPTVCDLDHKIGLTPKEREEIIKALSQMKQTVQENIEIERKQFSDAQRKLKELLIATKTRLTQADINEFVDEAQRIKRIRNEKNLERLKDERKERHRKEIERQRLLHQIKVDNPHDCHCDIWSLLLKVFQLAMILLAFHETQRTSENLSGFLIIILHFVTILISLSLLVFFYSCGQKLPRTMLKAEQIYCLLSATAFCFATIFFLPRKSSKVRICSFAATIGYMLDALRILFQLRELEKSTNSPNNDNSDVTQLVRDENQNSTTRGESYVLGAHHIINYSTIQNRNYLRIGNVIESENVTAAVNQIHSTENVDGTELNLDFLDENCCEKATSNRDNYDHGKTSQNNSHDFNSTRHNNARDGHHSSSHFDSSSDCQSRTNYHHHTSNDHYTSNDYYSNTYDFGIIDSSDSTDYGGSYDCGGDDTGGGICD